SLTRGDTAVEATELPRFAPCDALPDRTAGASNDDLYIDHESASGGHWFRCDGTVATVRTPFQLAEIVEFAHFGRALVLDGALQSVERDEYIYHEALVQPALCLHAKPRRVLIVGGGEGATAREVLKHATVEEVVMVDIDGELIALAREHLQTWHRGSFDDPRLRLRIGDGYGFITATADRFDVIIIDLVDFFEGGPAESLYTTEFYRVLKRRLAPDGILVVQAMECDASELADHLRVRRNLAGLFSHMRSYLAFVPSFWSTWGFVIASDAIDPHAASPGLIDHVITERALTQRLRFYDGKTHQAFFALPKDLRTLLGEA
ncbi:MAG TPA: methyltransferase domain-containing protein, partial [Rhizomicrobium sp.]|nr:methyltransferase domain-containing protein [Rhizomicrobium sp.]